jgi:hypothetical protein
MAQIVTLTRVLSFINVGIGPSAPTKKTGVCHPATMDAINCAPLNGQPMQVNSELGVKREIPNSVSTTDMDSSFFLSYNSAPVDVTVYTNATYLSTGNGRAVGVFEHDLTVATDLNNMNPWGNMYTVNNPEWNTPSSLVGTHTNIAQSWLNRGDPSENTIMNKWAIAIGNTQKNTNRTQPTRFSVSTRVRGIVGYTSLPRQPVSGSRVFPSRLPVGTIVFEFHDWGRLENSLVPRTWGREKGRRRQDEKGRGRATQQERIRVVHCSGQRQCFCHQS